MEGGSFGRKGYYDLRQGFNFGGGRKRGGEVFLEQMWVDDEVILMDVSVAAARCDTVFLDFELGLRCEACELSMKIASVDAIEDSL